MLTLLELQREMRQAIHAAPSQALLDEIVSDRILARNRCNVYRNNYRVLLKEGLARVFPATRLLLGERYFDTMASLYVIAHPPRDPRLSRYGHVFSRFLGAREELASARFVTDVARLEWTLAKIGDAPAVATVDWAMFLRALVEHGGALALRFPRSVVLLQSAWPVHEIREQTLAGASAEQIAPLVETPAATMLLLYRDADDDPCELTLDRTAHTALRLLRAGRSFNQATRAAYAASPGYPVLELYRFLFQSGLVAGLSPMTSSSKPTRKENRS